ncbi:MAG: tetratricopeptide repeat protein [Xanthomonadales bacterium]|nr:tetratricopeptide repeat protein [Xanthomonadales bacterium]
MSNSNRISFDRLHALALATCCALGLSASFSLQAASEQTLQSYAEAVDFLDRWHGDREMLDAAHERLTELLIDAPDFAPAHVEMARWYLMNSQNYPAALRSLERAEALDPEFPGIFVLRGYVFERQNRLDEALQQLDRAEAIGTDNPWLPLNRAAVLAKLGRDAEALPLYESVLEGHLDDPKAWPTAKARAIELHERAANLDAAEAVLLRAKALKPDDLGEAASYWYWLSARNRLDEALAMVREARKRWSAPELAHDEFSLHLEIARQLLAVDRDASRAAFQEASRIGAQLNTIDAPNFEEWARMQEAQSRDQVR